MDQNNIRSDGMNSPGQSREYATPQTKEEFRQVLQHAQQGEYQTDYYQTDYIEPPKKEQELPEQKNVFQPIKRESFSDYGKPYSARRFAPVKNVKKRKKFNPLAVIVPVILLLTAAAVLYFIFFINTVTYRKTEENYFGKLYSSVLSLAEKAEEKSTGFSPSQLNVNVSSPLGNKADIADIDLSNVSLNLNTAVQGGGIYNTLDIVLGKTSIAAEGWIDREKKSVFMFLPDASDIYAYLDYSAAADKTDLTAEYVKAFAEVLGKTSETYFELIGEPEIIKEQEFTVNETAYTADKYVIRLDGIQTAKIEKALIDNLIENEKTADILCKRMGCKNKDELLSDKKIKAELDRLNEIINNRQAAYPVIDMTVYTANKTVIGREAVITFSAPDETDETGSQTYFKLFDIPEKDGNSIYFHYKNGGDEITVSCDDKKSADNKDLHNGTLSVSCGDNTYTASYSEFAVTDELFRGKAVIASKKEPALAAAIEMKAENGIKQVAVSIPNILTATVEIKPSEMPFKEIPVLFEGDYADFSDHTYDKEHVESEAEKGAAEKFGSDINKYILKLLGSDNSDENNKNDSDNKTDTPDTEAPTENPDDGNQAGSEESETTAAESSAPTTAEAPDSEDPAQTVSENPPETSGTESSAPVNEAPPASSSGAASPNVPQTNISSASTLDVGSSQKITNSQLDSFNGGNYYKTEIYVDGAANANSSVYISEISGSFDGYIKGKALQINFAEGYGFDSALVVLTIPSDTVTGGRNYPDSDVLSGLNRYRIMGMKNTDEYEQEVEFYKYSGNQIGFIVEESGYYYLIDMDEYYRSVFGMSPDDMYVQYAE